MTLTHHRNESKIINEIRKNTVMCECGRRVGVTKLNNKGWTVCSWCGRKIERPKDAFKHKLMDLMEGEK